MQRALVRDSLFPQIVCPRCAPQICILVDPFSVPYLWRSGSKKHARTYNRDFLKNPIRISNSEFDQKLYSNQLRKKRNFSERQKEKRKLSERNLTVHWVYTLGWLPKYVTAADILADDHKLSLNDLFLFILSEIISCEISWHIRFKFWGVNIGLKGIIFDLNLLYTSCTFIGLYFRSSLIRNIFEKF